VRAAADGDEGAFDLAFRLAEAVGAALEPINMQVAAVLAGGPFTVRRALDLVDGLARPIAPAALATVDPEEGANAQ